MEILEQTKDMEYSHTGEEDAQEEQDASETFESNVAVEYVKAEMEGVYQFGSAPVGQEMSVWSMRQNNVSEAAECLYQAMLAEKTEDIDVSSYNIPFSETDDQLGRIVSGVLNEHPELYFVEKEYGYSHNNEKIVYVHFTYDTSLNREQFQANVDQALAAMDESMSDLEKAIALHDYLAVNCEYDQDRLEDKTMPHISYTAY